MTELIIHRVGIEEIDQLYPALHAEVFGETNPFAKDKLFHPAIVYLCFIGNDEKYCGFVAGHENGVSSFYIQSAGYTQEYRGKYKTVSIFRDIVNAIHKEYRFISGRVNNKNTPALRMALHTGFKIIGLRVATNNDVLLEVAKERDNGISC